MMIGNAICLLLLSKKVVNKKNLMNENNLHVRGKGNETIKKKSHTKCEEVVVMVIIIIIA